MTVDGPDAVLMAEAGQALAMVVHELVTNAGLYKMDTIGDAFIVAGGRGSLGQMEQMRTPSPLNVTLSLFWSASYRQKGSSIEVHSFMNSIEPPGSAEMSEMAISLLGSWGEPSVTGIQGVLGGEIRRLASGSVIRRGVCGDQ